MPLTVLHITYAPLDCHAYSSLLSQRSMYVYNQKPLGDHAPELSIPRNWLGGLEMKSEWVQIQIRYQSQCF
jgi:hypothetical protein